MLKRLSFALLLLLSFFAHAQKNATVYGFIQDSLGHRISNVNIIVVHTNIMAISEEDGSYEITVPIGQTVDIAFSYTGRPTKVVTVKPLAAGEKYHNDIKMAYGVNLKEVIFKEERDRDKVSMQTINPKTANTLPNVSGNFEQILKTLPGVTSNNELSSQYNVRGGNYDENLIYVNDIEIYRPFLPRAGQQEGLSFIHTEMVENVKFSAGGFEARYGDKMSSVLDIKYKDPKKFGASVNLSLLGAQAHIEGSTKNRRFTYLVGSRIWSNQYVLNTLDVQGDYRPLFADVQTLLTYHLTDKLSVSFLGSYAQNRYLMIPQDRETVFGTVKTALQLKMFFAGQDLMEYRTATGALSVVYKPNYRTQLKFYSSVFHSNENEFFTIEGAYRLEEVETDLGSQNFGQAKASKGIGYFLSNARNEIDAWVYNAGHRGYLTIGKNNIQWGVQAQGERIKDKMNEWYYNDSLGFAQPTTVDGPFNLNEYVSANNAVNSYRLSGYVQNSQILYKPANMILNYGVRTNWWSYNNENVLSPRVQFSFEPNRRHNRAVILDGAEGKVRKDIVLKAAFGYYYQPPFYREMRGFDGTLNPNIKAQLAIHYVLGGDINFKAWNRPFKFFAEAYYKKLENLIPYEIDNVRLRYYAENSAQGYATGLDMRLNGEFVKGTESWASLSIMKTQEKIPGALVYDESGNRVEPGYIPRPTDQRVNASIMFQDYLPNFPTWRMYLNLIYGSQLPAWPPLHNKYSKMFTIPPYRRVDIGFMKVLVDENAKKATSGWKKYFKSAMIGLEVFNLLDINNTISYIWVEDVEGRTWAVPNYLTGRRVNIRVMMKF